MAKKSKIARDQQRRRQVERFAARRKALKETLSSPHSTWEEKEEARIKLQKLPRNASPVRVVNRCALTGRSRAYLRKFGLCRIAFRELALQGQIPGVTKSSW